MRLEHTCEKSLQALAKQGLLKGARTCKLEFCEHCVSKRRPRWNSTQRLTAPRGFWILFTPMFGDLQRWHLL